MKILLKRSLVLLVTCAILVVWTVSCSPTAEDSGPGGQKPSSGETAEKPSDKGDGEVDVVKLPPYEITYYMLCNTVSPDRDKIVEQANKILKDKINATLDLVMLDWGTWFERFNTAMNAGEKVDIAFTADWWGYINSVANNYFLPLNDPEDNLLEKYAPQVVKNLGEGFVVGSQIDGINYAVPTDKEFAVNGGIVWNVDIAEKYGFDMSKVNSIADLEPMLKVVKENELNIIPYLISSGNAGYIIPHTSFYADMGVDYSKLDDTEIEWWWERQDWVELMKLHQKYYKEGYIHKDAYTDNNRYGDHLLAGNFFVCQQPLKPGKGKSTELMTGAGNKFRLDEKDFTPYVATSLHAAGSMLAIPRTSNDPARAMMFINLLHTEPELTNLFVWGIEGVHHKVVQENPKKVAPIEGNTWTAAILPWTLGSVFVHWLGEHEDPMKHEGFRQTKQAPAHITLGYRFLQGEKYQAELAALNDAMAEFSAVLSVGAVDNFDETYNKMMQAAERAGMKKIKEAVQQDLNAWLEKMGKK